MCFGFGAVMLASGDLYFTTPSSSGNVSHDHIIEELIKKGLLDRPRYPKKYNFIRLECDDWQTDSSVIDEDDDDYPLWLAEGKTLRKFNRLLLKVRPSYLEYREICLKTFNDYKKCNYADSMSTAAHEAYLKIVQEPQREARELFIKKLSEIKGYLPDS